jgi:hypothetical protein
MFRVEVSIQQYQTKIERSRTKIDLLTYYKILHRAKISPERQPCNIRFFFSSFSGATYFKN